MSSGGKRAGAGRPKGAKDKLDREAAEAAAAEGLMPREFLLGVVRDTALELATRIEAAKAAAPYYHARLTEGSIKHTGPDGGPIMVITGVPRAND